MAEAMNGTFKAELIDRQTWRDRDQVERAVVRWVGWYNHTRLHARSATYHPPNTKPCTTVRSTPREPPDPHITASIKLGAPHEDPKPFVWKAAAQDIIAKVQRGRATLHQIKTGSPD
jgi:hypothetical protein